MRPRRPYGKGRSWATHLLRLAALLLVAVAVAAAIQGRGEASADGGWAYRYGRWTRNLDQAPGPGRGFFDEFLNISSIAPGGPGVLAAGTAGQVCSDRGCDGDEAGAILGIGGDGQMQWLKLYYTDRRGQYADETRFGLLKAVDGGFVVAGSNRYYGYFVAQVDGSGNVLWARSLNGQRPGGTPCDNISDVEQMGGGLVALTAGRCLFRTDASGNILWARFLDSRLWAYDILPWGDNILVAGTYAPSLACGSDYRCFGFVGLLKGDGSGFQWLRYYYPQDPPASGWASGSVDRLLPYPDGNVIADAGGGGLGDVMKFRPNDGLVLWWKDISPGSPDDLIPYGTGFLVVGPYIQPPNTFPCRNDIFVAVLDGEANVQQSSVLGGDGCDGVARAAVTAEGIYVALGATFWTDGGLPVVMKLGADLSVEGYGHSGQVSSGPVSDPFPNSDDEKSQSQLSFSLGDVTSPSSQPITLVAVEGHGRQAPWYYRFLDVAVDAKVRGKVRVTSSPEGIDCDGGQSDCWEAYPHGTTVTVTLQELQSWPPAIMYCGNQPGSNQVTLSLTQPNWFSRIPSGDVTCDVRVDGSAIDASLSASPESLTLRQLEGSDRPPVNLTYTLESRGSPVQGVPVEVAITEAQGRCLNNPQEWCDVPLSAQGVLALNEPRATGQDGTYSFSWIPPSASALQAAVQLPVRFQFAVCPQPWTIQDFLNYYWGACRWEDVEITPTTTVRGRVVQRHAGALQDPDGDGLSPVPFVDVSTDPTFPPDRTALTGDDGAFTLEDVPCNQDVTIYVQQIVPGEQYRVYTQSKWDGYLACPTQGSEVDIGDIYVAHLGVTRQMLGTYLPALRQKLGQGSDGVYAHTQFVDQLRRRIAPSSNFGPTKPWEEEALRRLSLSEQLANEGLDTMLVMGECGVRYLWDASLGIMVGIFNKMVDTYLDSLFKKADKLREIRIKQGLGQPVPDADIKEVARLNSVEKAIAEAVATWQERLDEMARSLLGSSEPVMQYFLSRLPPELGGGGPSPLWHVDLEKWEALGMASQALGSYDIVKALYDWAKGVDQAAAELSDWPSVVNAINSLRDQLLAPVTDLIDQLHDAVEELAMGAVRAEVDRWLQMTADWAWSGDFTQGPDSYRQAAERAAAYARRLSDLWGRWSALCTNMENFYDIVYETAGAVQLAANLSALVSGGSSVALSTAMETVQWATLATKAATGLVFIGMAQPLGEAGQLTRLGMFDVFDKASIIQQEQEDLARAVSVVAFSPVHIMAVDRLGRRVGIDGQGMGYSEVPGAAYLPAGELPMPDGEQGQTVSPHETLVLPLEHAPYTILVWGTGEGSYTIKVTAAGEQAPQELATVSGTAQPGSLQLVSLAAGDGPVVQLGQPQDFSQDLAAGLAVYGRDGRVDGPLSLTAGEAITLKAYLQGRGGETVPPGEVTWESSAPETASIEPLPDGTAVVRAGRAGEATITVRAGSRSATVVVNVTAGRPAQVQVEAVGQLPVTAGDQACVRAQVLDAGLNPVPGVTVTFLAFGNETAVGQAASGQDGRTQTVCFTTPPTAGGPEVVQGVVLQDGEVTASGRATLTVAPSIQGAGSWPERTGGRVEIRHGDELVGYIDVPAGALAAATAPLLSGTVVDEPTGVPAAPQGKRLLRVVAVSLLDLATGEPITPSSSLHLALLGEGNGLELARASGTTWQALPGQPVAGGMAADIDGPGTYALFAQSGGEGAGGGSGGGGSPPPPPPPPPPPTAVTVPSPTGTGNLTFQVASGATPASFQVQPFTGTLPVPAPQGYSLPHGLYSLTAAGLPPGASITVQVTLPAPAPVGTVWLKLLGGSWVALPVGDDDGDNVITITLTDGGQGDADGTANGVIADPGGPAIPQEQPTPTPTPPPPSTPPAAPGLVSLWPCGEGVACISFLPSQGATSYRLESALDPGFSFGLSSVEVDASSLLWGNTIVVGMPTGDMWAFYYRLSACNGAGCSGAVLVGGMAARRFPAGTSEHWAFVVGGYRFLGVSYGWAQSQVSVPGKASELHLYDGVQGYGGTRVHTCSGVQPGGTCSWQWASGDPWLSGSQEFPPYGEVGVAVRLSP